MIMPMTKEEILRRIEIEDVRIQSADKNISALIAQKTKSQQEQDKWWVLYNELISTETVNVSEETTQEV